MDAETVIKNGRKQQKNSIENIGMANYFLSTICLGYIPGQRYADKSANNQHKVRGYFQLKKE